MVTWIRDSTLPPAPTVTSPATTPYDSNDVTLTLAGTCITGYQVELTGAAQQSSPCTGSTFSIVLSPGVDGEYAYVLTQKDEARGLTSGQTSFVWRRDTQPPASVVITAPSANPYTSSENALSLSGTCEADATVVLTGDGAASTTCNAGQFVVTTQKSVNGTFTFSLVQSDRAGNASPSVSFTWVRDDTVPQRPFVTDPLPPHTSNSASLTMSGVCKTGYIVYLQGDQTASTTCANNAFSFTVNGTSDRQYRYVLTQENPVTGTRSAEITYAWNRDTTAPVEVAFSGPGQSPYFSGDDLITISGTCERDRVVEVSGAASEEIPCPDGSFAFTSSQTEDDTYNFSVMQTDRAGNTSLAALFQWVRDSTLLASPTLVTPATNPYVSSGATLVISGGCTTNYQVTLSGDEQQTVTCANGSFSFTVSPTVDGTYDYAVKQTNLEDVASSPTTITWTRDTSPPAALARTSPTVNPYTSGSYTLAFQGTCEPGALIKASGDVNGETVCVDGKFTFNLEETAAGTYQYAFLQQDAAQNSSPALSFTWTIDNTLPATPLLSSPVPNPYASNTTSLSIAGSCTGSNLVTLSGDGSGSATCAGGIFAFAVNRDVDGTSVYSVKQTDAVTGNDSAATVVTWTLDRVPPAAPTLIAINPRSPSANLNPKVTGSVDGQTAVVDLFRSANCSGTVAASETPAAFTGDGTVIPAIAQDSMTVSARARDEAGNVSPCATDSLAYAHRAVELIADINALATSGSSGPNFFVEFKDMLLFRADDGKLGSELWRSDGTSAGTKLLKDLNPSDGSAPGPFHVIGDFVLFAATDPDLGRELWISDGTANGTTLLKDINPGAFSSSPTNFVQVGEYVYFTAATEEEGRELWRTDGTNTGTVLVWDIEAGDGSSSPAQLTAIGGDKLVFNATTIDNGVELYASATASLGGTLHDIRTGENSSSPNYFVAMGGYVYFAATDAGNTGAKGLELWRSDGVNSPELAADIYPGTGSSSPAFLAVAGDTLYFRARKVAGTDYRLWKYTSAGGAQEIDVPFGSNGGTNAPVYITALDETRVVFRASQNAIAGLDLEPWVSEGTVDGTFRLKDINQGDTQRSLPTVFTAMNGKVFFAASSDSTDRELWMTDGTTGGTTRYDVNQGVNGSHPAVLRPFKNGLVGSFVSQGKGRESWYFPTDGPSPVAPLLDINARSSSTPAGFVKLGDTLLFAAEDDAYGRELYAYDLNTGTASLVKDINAGGASSSPAMLTKAGSYVYFRADDGNNGVELWRTDGTPSGTALVTDICQGEEDSTPNWLVEFGEKLLFAALSCADDVESASGLELYSVTGTGQATLVTDLNPGSAGSSPANLVVMGDYVYFAATRPAEGREMWRSDGTEAGTQLVADLRTGKSSSSPSRLRTVGGDQLVFVATYAGTTNTGAELYVSDGTSAGTKLVKDIYPGVLGSGPTNLTEMQGRIYFTAKDDSHGVELWTSDGTPEGTTLVKDIRVGTKNSNPSYLFAHADKLYFSALEDATGVELWVSDGTETGTHIVLDARPGPLGSSAAYFAPLEGSSFFFTYSDGVNGREPWCSDGTAAGTYLIQDINPFGAGWGGALFPWDGQVYVSLSDVESGVELYRY